MLIVRDRCSSVLSICPQSRSIPDASTENRNNAWGFRLFCMWMGQGAAELGLCYRRKFARSDPVLFTGIFDEAGIAKPSLRPPPSDLLPARYTDSHSFEAYPEWPRTSRSGVVHESQVHPLGAFPYPDYYLRDFHHQANGNLSWRAAVTYEWQLRFLFVGCAKIMRQAVVDEIPEGRNLKVLDVACGTGSWIPQGRLQNRGHEITGVDLSPSYLRLARRTGDFDELQQLNAENLPKEWTGRFDIVTCVWLFHELPTAVQARITSEVARVLRPGGRLVFMDSRQWSKDAPGLFTAMGGRSIFSEVFNEPYLLDYLKTDLQALFAREGLHVAREKHCFKSKVLVAYKVGHP